MARLFFTDHYLITLPEGHKFPSRKYGLVRDLLRDDGRFRFEPAPIPASEIIQLAHDPNYVRSFVAGSLPAASMRQIGLPWSDVLVKRALASVGGTLCAAQDALKLGWGGTLGGGTHHAFRSEGAGFCIFNDIAVTIQFLRTTGLIRNAAVIDLDVHQGDGTAEIFRDDPEVFTLSIHCNSNFPFRKQQSTLDVALRDGVEDEEYLDRLNEVLPQVLDWHPEIVFYQSGVDGLGTDVLGHLALTHQGLIARDRLVMESMRQAGIPLVLTSGGGYSRPIELSADAHANTYRTAWQVFAAESTADVGSFAAGKHRD
ncbi:MAG TPA: histone deacetylase [Candidatus Angelobacter sp.]|nr:histone deacetylase [Candidatus Angelobacter sp.]